MPIQLPTLDRVAPVAPGTTGRVQSKSIDTSSAFGASSNAASKAVNAAVSVFDKAEQDAYNSKISELGHQLDRFGREKLEGDPDNPGTGLRYKQGDPDEHYASFDDELGVKRDELLSSSGLQGKALEKAKGTLNKRYNSLYNSSLTYYGAQRVRYKQKLANDSVDIHKKDAFTSLNYYDVKDARTLEPFNVAIDDIRQERLEEAVSVGTASEVTKDFKGSKYRVFEEDGTEKHYSLNDSVKSQIRKDVSDATYESVNGMVKAGKIDEARELIKAYGDQMDPVNKAKIDESFHKKEVEQLAYGNLGRLSDLPFEKKRAKVKALPSGTPRQAEIKSKTMQMLDASARYVDNERKHVSKSTYDQISSQLEVMVDPNRAGANLIDNTLGMENAMVEVDGVKAQVKDFLPNITEPTQRKALFKMVEKRSTSGDNAGFGKIMDMARTGSLYGVSFPELQEIGVGLSEKQWTTAVSAWRQTIDTQAGTRSTTNDGYRKMVSNAQNLGIIKKSRRTKTWTKDSKVILEDLSERYWQEESLSINKSSSPSDIDKIIRKINLDKKKQIDVEKSGGFFDSFSNLFGSSDSPGPTASPSGGFDALSEQQMSGVATKYKKANPNKDYSMDDLRKFYEEDNNAN